MPATKPKSDLQALQPLTYGSYRHRIIPERGTGCLIIQRGSQVWGKGFSWEGRCSPHAHSVEELEAYAAQNGLMVDYHDI